MSHHSERLSVWASSVRACSAVGSRWARIGRLTAADDHAIALDGFLDEETGARRPARNDGTVPPHRLPHGRDDSALQRHRLRAGARGHPRPGPRRTSSALTGTLHCARARIHGAWTDSYRLLTHACPPGRGGTVTVRRRSTATARGLRARTVGRASDSRCRCGVQFADAGGVRVPFVELGDDVADRGPRRGWTGSESVPPAARRSSTGRRAVPQSVSTGRVEKFSYMSSPSGPYTNSAMPGLQLAVARGSQASRWP